MPQTTRARSQYKMATQTIDVESRNLNVAKNLLGKSLGSVGINNFVGTTCKKSNFDIPSQGLTASESEPPMVTNF